MNKISDIQMFRAFRSRNYSLYFAGRSVSQFGTWMQRIAVIWLVYSITNSLWWSGVTAFAEQFPSFLVSIPGGIIADRFNRYTVIKVTQVASMAQSVLLALLVLTGHDPMWAILTLSVVLGIINAIDIPARQTLLHEVVAEPSDLPNALALTTATASLAQLLGPSLSGFVLNAWGAAVCFLINAASFGGVFLSVVLMKVPPPTVKRSDKKVWTEFTEGFMYVVKTRNLATVILMLSIVSLLVLPYSIVLPEYAKVVFKGNASTFGYINSFVGIGGVAGTIFLATRKPGTDMRKILLVSILLLGAALVGFSRTTNFPLAMFFGAVAGFGAIAQYTISNILIQSESDPKMRGRAIGVLFMAIFGMMPLGALLIGAVSSKFGAPVTVLCEGVASLVVLAVFFRRLTVAGAAPTRAEVEEAIEETVA
ncbi:MAG TPA: MFS transporter [Dinghuibacter sp.]|uniref:MFS transporter n=1 Tax=Dinghuibacter sp. TaxID=2024697 RepID=UPI002C1AC6DE|nr:MFS transporter [Dinghuibacter sp.]HTJ11303.1 MFS transporter [Dinghuibacter sp.]